MDSPLRDMNKFYKAWWYLEEHRIFQWGPKGAGFKDSYFSNRALDIYVTKVNPKTMEVDDNKKKNTIVDIWLECGPLSKKDTAELGEPIFEHDPRLDTGGATFEEAIINLSKLVKKYYE